MPSSRALAVAPTLTSASASTNRAGPGGEEWGKYGWEAPRGRNTINAGIRRAGDGSPRQSVKRVRAHPRGTRRGDDSSCCTAFDLVERFVGALGAPDWRIRRVWAAPCTRVGRSGGSRRGNV